MPSNNNLHLALKNKNDEFYTFYEDIERECSHYKEKYCDKVIYLPTDTENSNFFKYFSSHFDDFKIKQIIATHLDNSRTDGNYVIIQDKHGIVQDKIKGNGDFFSEECQQFLAGSDIVITNPPFSLARAFVMKILSCQKDFLLVINENIISSKEIFPLFQKNLVKFGYNTIKKFYQADNTIKEFGNIIWLSSWRVERVEFIPDKDYNNNFQKYDNYDAINIDNIKNIPKNYSGIMGVPLTYLKYHNPRYFDIIGLASGNAKKNQLYGETPYYQNNNDRGGAPLLDGKIKYTRIFIKRKEISNDR